MFSNLLNNAQRRHHDPAVAGEGSAFCLSSMSNSRCLSLRRLLSMTPRGGPLLQQPVRRLLGVLLMLTLVAVLFLNCGSSSSPTPGSGTVFTFIGDLPSCDILSFHVLITDVVLTPVTGPGMGHGLPVNSTPTFNFAGWRDANTVLGTNTMIAEAYNQGQLVMSTPTLVIYDPTQNPPIRTVPATLPGTAPTFAVNPPLMVTQGQVAGLGIEFNMLSSIQFQVSSTGTLTAAITPTLAFAALTASPNQGFGDTSARGFVQSVTTSTTSLSANGTPFTGGFTMQLLSPSLAPAAGAPASGPAVAINLIAATQLCGPMTGPQPTCPTLPLNTLLTGTFGNADGYVDSKGNWVATAAELEDQEDVAQQKAGFLGPILSVTTDSNGNATQFTLFVREEQPDVQFGAPNVPLDSVVTVNTVPAPVPTPPAPFTVYGDAGRVGHPGGLQFGPTSLTVGQEVAVHGVFTAPPSGSGSSVLTTIAADSIYLQSQAYQGSFTSLLQVGSDDKSGAFVFVPCGTMFQRAPVMVFTDSQTNFVNVAGLSSLVPQSTLILKGLLFFDRQGRNINGVTVPPGTLVLLAAQVRPS